MIRMTLIILLVVITKIHAQHIGIGIDTPKATLHIHGQVEDTILLLITVPPSDTPILHINMYGKVGINTNNPQEALDVHGSIGFTGPLMPAGNAGLPGQILISQGDSLPPTWKDLPPYFIVYRLLIPSEIYASTYISPNVSASYNSSEDRVSFNVTSPNSLILRIPLIDSGLLDTNRVYIVKLTVGHALGSSLVPFYIGISDSTHFIGVKVLGSSDPGECEIGTGIPGNTITSWTPMENDGTATGYWSFLTNITFRIAKHNTWIGTWDFNYNNRGFASNTTPITLDITNKLWIEMYATASNNYALDFIEIMLIPESK